MYTANKSLGDIRTDLEKIAVENCPSDIVVSSYLIRYTDQHALMKRGEVGESWKDFNKLFPPLDYVDGVDKDSKEDVQMAHIPINELTML